jgi:hypothetical protein
MIWLYGSQILMLVAAVGLLLWAFHEEVERMLFTKQEYLSVKVIGFTITIAVLLLGNALGILLDPVIWHDKAFGQLALAMVAAISRWVCGRWE